MFKKSAVDKFISRWTDWLQVGSL